MQFDQTRNAAELRELLDYLTCIAIGCLVAAASGMSWVVASLIVLYAFSRWKKKGRALSPRLRVLAVLACFGVLLLDNWSSYCAGVSAGYDATATSGKGVANKSVPGSPGSTDLRRS